MGPIILTFILEIAKEVIKTIIVDFVKGKRDSKDRKEIEQQVLAEVFKRKKEYDSKYINQIAREVMNEIDIIVARDPILKVTDESIKLAQPIKPPLFSKKERFINEQLTQQLAQLDEIILHRREQLGLPTKLEPIESEVQKLEADEIPVGWEQVDSDGPKSEWKQELKVMQDKIRRRRESQAESNE